MAADPCNPVILKPSTRFKYSDQYDDEFRFYSKLLPNLILMITKDKDRELILPWIHKLSSPGYNVVKLRDKRNRYMLMLCMCLITNSVEGPFALPPPSGVLPDITKITRPCKDPYDWETDRMWEQQLSELKNLDCLASLKVLNPRRCYHHQIKCPPIRDVDRPISDMLDRQFRFFLYISKPYAAMLMRSSDRIRTSKWMQTLCSIDANYCTIAKGIRNDYMVILAGYLASQTIIGPFESDPTDKLMPLGELAAQKDPICIIDPTHPKTSEFFKSLPHPEEGAFAYIAVTGDLYNPKI